MKSKNNKKLILLKEQFLKEANTSKNFDFSEDIDGFLDWLAGKYFELKDFIFEPADGRIDKKLALACKTYKNGGGISTKSDFLTYKEMNQLLRGYQLKAEDRFKK